MLQMHSEHEWIMNSFWLVTTSSLYALEGYVPIMLKRNLKSSDVGNGSSNIENSHRCVT